MAIGDSPVQAPQSVVQSQALRERSQQYRSFTAARQASLKQQKAQVTVPELRFPFETPNLTQEAEPSPTPWYRKPAELLGSGLEGISKPFVWINQNLEKPWASLLVLAAQGIVPGEQSLEKALRERQVDEGWVETLVKAYTEDEELNTWGKFALETTMPLWYMVPGALAKVGGKLLGPVAKNMVGELMKVPLVQKMSSESAKSLAFNAPRRGANLVEMLGGAYDAWYLKTGAEEASTTVQRLLRDLIAGKIDDVIAPTFMDTLTHSSTVKTGPRLLRILNDVMGADPDIANTVRTSLQLLETQTAKGLTTLTDISDAVAGSLRRAYAEKAGLHGMSFMRDTLSDVYQFWRAGVLTTPTYVMQNLVEDFFRVMTETYQPIRWGPSGAFELPFPIGKFKLNRFSSAWEAARKGMIPHEIANQLLPMELRRAGFTSLAEAQAELPARIEQIWRWHNEVEPGPWREYLMRQARQYEKILESMDTVKWSMESSRNVISATEAVTSDAMNPHARKHPMMRFMDAVYDKLAPGLDKELFDYQTILATKGEKAAKAFRADKESRRFFTKQGLKNLVNYPRDLAGVFDTSASAQIYMNAFSEYLKNNPGPVDVGRLLDETLFTKEMLMSLKQVGVSDEAVYALRDLIKFADSPTEAMDYIFQTIGKPYPVLDKLTDGMSGIPYAIGEKYKDEVTRAAFTVKRGEVRDIKQRMLREVEEYYSTPEFYRNELQKDIIDSLRLSEDQIDKVFKPLDKIMEELGEQNKRIQEVLTEIFGEPFTKKLESMNLKFSREFLEVEAEATTVLTKYIQKTLATQGRGRGTSRVLAKARHEFETTFANTLSRVHAEHNELLQYVMAFNEFYKSVKDPIERAAKWQEVWRAIARQQPYMRLDMLQGLRPDKVNVSLLWERYRLTRARLYREGIKSMATDLNVAHLIALPVQERLDQARQVIDLTFNRLLSEMPTTSIKGLTSLEQRLWRYMGYNPDKELNLVQMAADWKVNEADLMAAFTKLDKLGKVRLDMSDIGRGGSFTMIERPPKLMRRGAAKKRDTVITNFFEQVQAAYTDPAIGHGSLMQWRNNEQAKMYALDKAFAAMGEYGVTTNLDEIMNRIVPFWYFPSRSIPFYLKTFAQKPYLMADLQRYMQNTKDSRITPESLVGYMAFPVGDQYFYVNPMRPWMGYQIMGQEPMAGVGQPLFQQVQQMFGMLGFGFNPAITWSAEAINNITSTQGLFLTRGEVMPLFPQEKWFQDLIGLTLGTWLPTPEQSLFAQTEQGMPDWKKRNIEKELARYLNKNPDLREVWSTPRQLWTDAVNGNAQAQDIIKEQTRRLSAYGLLSSAFPVYNRRNKEEIQMYKDRDAMLNDIFKANGLTDEQIQARLETANKQGFSPMMYLNKAQRREIYEAKPEWEPWQGLTRVGIRPEEREMERQTEEFFQTFDEASRQIQQQLSVVDNAFMNGLISGYDWRLKYNQIQQFHAAAFQMLVGDGKSPDTTSNPGRLPLARVTNERVEYFRERFGTSIPPVHPEDEALNMFQAISPEMDPLTGLWDFDTYYVQREEFLAAMPYGIRKYIEDDMVRSRYNSTVEAMYRKDMQTLKPYLSARRDVMKLYPEYKVLQDRLSREPDPRERLKVQQKLSKYERMVSEKRQQLRIADAQLEYLLLKWGYVTSILNPKTNEILDRIYR